MIRQIRAASVIAVGIVMVASPRAVLAQCELAKLLADDAAADDEFGYSVAISGDYAVIGAWKDDGNAGAAYVFKRTGTAWNQVQKLTASDAEAGDRFGASVAIDGDTLVVGAFLGDAADDNLGTGAAYVFFRDGTGTWSEQAKLVADDATASDWFGWDVGINGDLAVVGAPHNDAVADNSGAAYVFKRSGIGGTATWAQEKLVASDAFEKDELGKSVSISGEVIIVGAAGSDLDGKSSAGAAYVFRFNSDTSLWDETQKLVASDPTANAEFGSAVSIDGNTAVVGARKATGISGSTGAAYLFEFDGGEWTQQAKVDAFDGASLDEFGAAVSVSGDFAVVGALKDDDAGSSTGAAYFFKREAGTWVSLEKLTASDMAGGAEFGFSVALDGDFALVGARRDAEAGSRAGAAYVHVVGGGQGTTVECITCGVAGDCDDGRICTTGDCPSELGVCTFRINEGECLIDGDCKNEGEENLLNKCQKCDPLTPSGWSPKAAETLCAQDTAFCNGEEVCDGAGVCVSPGDPCAAPVRFCDEPGARCVQCLSALACDDDNECTENICDDGTCSNPNWPIDTPCGVATDTECDGADTCDGAGICLENEALFGTSCTADDGTECTVDSCSGGTCFAQPLPNGTPCTDNGLFCDGLEECFNAACLPSNEDPCAASGLACDEGADACKCDAATAGACNNGLPCTVDDCDLGTGLCTHTPTAGNCFINNTCHVLGNLNPLNDCEECNPATDPLAWTVKAAGASCSDDGNQCTDDECDGAGTCAHINSAVGASCDDGLFCTVDDACDTGTCTGTGSPCAAEQVCDENANVCKCVADPDCDDGVPCTTDSCDLGPGLCNNVLEASSCLIDGVCHNDQFENPANECEECNAALDAAKWSPRTGEICGDDDDPDDCIENRCDIDGACMPTDVINGTPCADDGLFCNGDESCLDGACDGHSGNTCELSCEEGKGCICATDAQCNDNNGCTDDFCGIDDVCVHTPNSEDCDDGEFCTAVDKCDGGECTGSGSPCAAGLVCNEAGNSCGCAQDADCDDGQFCNGEETCAIEAGEATGECLAGVAPCLGEGLLCDEDADACAELQTGACCRLAVRGCLENVSSTVCDSVAGYYVGPDSDCTEGPPVAPCEYGACCAQESCIAAFRAECLDLGGLFQGPGSTCQINTCPGACCQADGTCAETTKDLCSETWLGQGTVCSATACRGACCFGDICVGGQIRDNCLGAGGLFAGAGSNCSDPDICVNGGCCLGNACLEKAETDCLIAGGRWLGLFTDCVIGDDEDVIPEGGNGVLDACECTAAPGDIDFDGDVDLDDYAAFIACFTGPGPSVLVELGCECADFDEDSDVDLFDFTAFQGWFGGIPVCGDGVLGGTEECDDGGSVSDDGCSSDCSVESGFTCSGAPSVCQNCGDGIVEGTEICDDGGFNGSGWGYCLADCSGVQGGGGTVSLSAVALDSVICLGTSTTINASASGGVSPYSYTYSILGGAAGGESVAPTTDSSGGATSSTTYTAPSSTTGTRTVRVQVTESGGSSDVVDVSMLIPGNPAADAGPDIPAQCDDGADPTVGDSPTGTGGTAPHSFTWTGGGVAFLSSTTTANPQFDVSAAGAGTYEVCVGVSDSEGCASANDCATITVISSTCGDGVTECNEVCDEGTLNGTGDGHCLGDCSGIQTCGDGATNGTELCDDGNNVSGDGCDANCRTESGPANDSCSTPQAVGNSTISFVTDGATTDSISVVETCSSAAPIEWAADVWFRYEATCTGTATISLCGSRYDTTAAVYGGSGCPSDPALVCNDDGCGPGADAPSSRVTFPAVEGDSYTIRIGGYVGQSGADMGAGSLTVFCGSASGRGPGNCGSGSSDCFTVDPSPTCSDAGCCGTICVLDPYCCDVEWDGVCVEEGIGICSDGFAVCTGATGDCFSGHLDQSPGCSDSGCCQAVCEQGPFCCVNSWDDFCAQDAAATCSAAEVCAGATGSCIVEHATPGCSIPTCCEAVCLDDPFCCTTEWDATCATAATSCR